jgi:hypothetical protein
MLDGQRLGAEVTVAPYRVAWNTASTANGTHVLTAVARDAAGNARTSAGVSVRVANSTSTTDVTPPTISGASVSPTSSGAVITWTTNEPSTTWVEYGATKVYEIGSLLNTTLKTSHSMTIGGLRPGTVYHARIKGRDAAGNLAVSGDLQFTTRP